MMYSRGSYKEGAHSAMLCIVFQQKIVSESKVRFTFEVDSTVHELGWAEVVMRDLDRAEVRAKAADHSIAIVALSDISAC